jgi:proteic killer suppression protein
MIISFGNKATEHLYHGINSKESRKYPRNILTLAIRKLDMLNGTQDLIDLRSPPGNQLEALKGDLKGFHSIRINDQWRVIFKWDAGQAKEVQITDYH